MSKTVLFTASTGAIVPEVGTDTITVVSWSTPIGIVLEFQNQNDKLLLVRRSLDDKRWEPVTDDKGDVWLSAKRKSAALTMPDVYGLQGYTESAVTAYKVEE